MAMRRVGPTTPCRAVKEPSTSFSDASYSSAASIKSAGSSRSGCSRLLFGEIDTNSARSLESFASVYSFVLSESSIFLKFWLDDRCRNAFLSHLPTSDLANLRLACHDFSARAAAALFKTINLTFKTSTFTKPAKLAALNRVGSHIKTLRFSLPYTPETLLPPLVDPETGAELDFIYTPRLEPPTAQRPKYGDFATTQLLARQYPALFHAATNVPAFVKAFSALTSLKHLHVSCPGYDAAAKSRRNVVEFALVSLGIAIERNNLHALTQLTLSPIHLDGLQVLLLCTGHGGLPCSAKTWSRLEHLAIYVESADTISETGNTKSNRLKLLRNHLRCHHANLKTFDFRWNGRTRASLSVPISSGSRGSNAKRSPGHQSTPRSDKHGMATASGGGPNSTTAISKQGRAIAARTSHNDHRSDIQSSQTRSRHPVLFGEIRADLLPETTSSKQYNSDQMADIPIMLSPTFRAPPASARQPCFVKHLDTRTSARNGKHGAPLTNWLLGRKSLTQGCGNPKANGGVAEGHLKKVWHGLCTWM